MDGRQIRQAAESIAARASINTVGSVLGKEVGAMCRNIPQRIKVHEAPLKQGFFRKLPFEIRRDRLTYELRHLCIYSGHIALQTTIPGIFELNVNPYYLEICKDATLTSVLYTNQERDHERRYSKYSDKVIKTLENKGQLREIAQGVQFVFNNFYYTDGNGIGLPNGGPYEDLFTMGLIDELFIMPLNVFRISIALL